MQVIRQLTQLDALNGQRTILTIGAYDGIHRGHRQILANLKAAAAGRGSPSALITFYPRPKTVLVPGYDGRGDYLTTVDEKILLFEQLGLDVLAILPFSREFAQTPAEVFMRQVIDVFHPYELWVGADFRLGKNRQGDVTFLQELGKTLDYGVQFVDLQLADHEKISSTWIRAALANGQIDEVIRLLGAYPLILGRVVQGAQRGRTIGFPTANIAVHPDKLLPVNGVYAVWVVLDGQVFPAVANIGIRPTFEEVEQTIEVHIFDFNRTIYGRTVQVYLAEFLRPEQKFPGLEALVAQISHDAAQARSILNGRDGPLGPIP